MSWFDAAGFANIAKSALKEAQKTIDKALDIKEDGSAVSMNTQIVPSSTDFFGTWTASPKDMKYVNKDLSFSPSKEDKTALSLWGSFTGSFFENPDKDKINSISLEDTVDGNEGNFSSSKLVVQHSEDGDDLYDSESQQIKESQVTSILDEMQSGIKETHVENPTSINTSPPVRRRETQKCPNASVDRLSAISAESGITSSESADIVTCSTEYTTSPESEVLSVGQSLSTSSSALGPQVTSDSIEILDHNLTSPSSFEIIFPNSTRSSRKDSQHTDEFVSPLQSPYSEELCCPTETISPGSIEVITGDQDDNSIADTMSYTSVSECTSTTVFEVASNPYSKQPKLFQEPLRRIDPIVENSTSDIASSPFIDAITRAPSRTTMHLPLTQVVNVLIDTQPQSTNQEISNMLQKTNIIDIPSDGDNMSNSEVDVSIDDGSHSDKTVISSDNVMESSSDTSTTESNSNSSYLKNMLADAMVEKPTDPPESPKPMHSSSNTTESLKSSSAECISLSQVDFLPRENSPISSESRSDLVKIGSDHTSGHTSGDDLETTTSSDIEIISSPNGDSSSTQSRQSPAKHNIKAKSEDSTIDSLLHKMTMKRAKGHTRELSGASSISDDFPSEIDRLLKKMSEMTEILESRESKLIDFNRRNAELQELNSDLRLQLDSILTKQLESIDVSQVTEEYTQRLSALEKKFQQTLRERDNLRKDLEQLKQEAATRVSNIEMAALLSEKEEIVKQLREEGEKLSKQQLQHSNIIKRLRTKERENENIIKNLRESVEGLSTDADRLKKSLVAKEDVERTQIEAVHQLTTKNKKIENELVKVKGQLDDLTQKYETSKKSLDAAKKEINEKHKFSSELVMREQMLDVIEKEKMLLEIQNEQMQNQLEDLRQKLRQTEEESEKREEMYREERSKLMRKLEEAETRNESLSQLELEVSKPLVRQLESLQATHIMKTATFEKIQEDLSAKIRELNSKVQTYKNSERITKEECFRLRSKLAEIENQQSTSNHKMEHLEMELEQLRTERSLLEQELNNKIEGLNDVINKYEESIVNKDKTISSLQHQLSLEKLTDEVETSRAENPQALNRTSEHEPTVIDRTSPQAGSNSPTLSLGKVSISDSFWSQDEPFDINAAPRYTNMFEMQMLQTNLKQREGELQQLQWEMNRRERERSLLNGEISKLITKVEELSSKTSEFDSLKTKFEELEKQYETLCQLYGEKVEENEELKLDLVDVKDMYRGQIDELLRQQKQSVK